MAERIGLIAGNRQLPITFAQEAQKQGSEIIAVCIKQDTSAAIKNFCQKCHWINVWELSSLFKIFADEKITQAAMVGQITPRYLFKFQGRFDPELKNLLQKISEKSADTIFGALAEKLNSQGIQVLDSTLFLKDLIPDKGTLTQLEPTPGQKKDIELGFKVAKQLGGLDIGQTVVIKNGAILAVEAFEGTDSTILRGGLLGGPGAVVVKTAKPNQDMRFDVPLVGLATLSKLSRVGVKALAVESHKTIILEKAEFIRKADRNSISVVAI